MPLDGDTIQPSEQHMENPITDPKQWAEMALMSPQAVQYGIKPLTHPKNLIETSTGEVIIQYTCGFPFNQYIKVAKISKNATTRTVSEGDSLDRLVALFTSSNTCTIMTRFTEPGTYEVELWANIENGHAALKATEKVLHYSITNTGRAKPLPRERDNQWGASRNFLDAGYLIVYPKSAIIKTSNGVAMIQVKLPTKGICPNMLRLYHSDKQGKVTRCDDYVNAEQRGNMATYFVQCPEVGEYKLEVCAKYDTKTEGLSVGAGFLIQCDTPAQNSIKFGNKSRLLGTNEHFHDLGFVTSAKSTTIHVRNGTARLRVKTTQPAEIFATLNKLGSDSSEQLRGTQEGDLITFNINPTEKGLYAFELYASKPNIKNKGFAGRFLVSYDTGFIHI